MYFSLNNMGCFCEHYYAFKVKNETKKTVIFSTAFSLLFWKRCCNTRRTFCCVINYFTWEISTCMLIWNSSEIQKNCWKKHIIFLSNLALFITCFVKQRHKLYMGRQVVFGTELIQIERFFGCGFHPRVIVCIWSKETQPGGVGANNRSR